MEYSFAAFAAISKLISTAKAAASNAGPRFADVAGNVSLSAPGCLVGLAEVLTTGLVVLLAGRLVGRFAADLAFVLVAFIAATTRSVHFPKPCHPERSLLRA